ncbi:MAG: 3-deoxy-7-phosphoheptulonate synthase [Melioribacteraceae bacterium]|nr:MAG: 3-deoxy-7-phosphoheptulonate synthase [Melioribacteraceae bacterium]
MIVVLKDSATRENVQAVKDYIVGKGAQVHESEGIEKKIIGIIGNKRVIDKTALNAFPGVEHVIQILEPYKLASRKFHPRNTIIDVKGVQIGGLEPVHMAGPCSVETEEQIWEIAKEVSEKGGHILRGGVFKPRSSPYSFQGIGLEGAKWMYDAGKEYNLGIVSEVMEINDIEALYDYVDIFQVGARNMQHFKLLKALGKTDKPVLLKRGMSATMNEFLMSAEYILAEGNEKVILCERGIRTFVQHTRNTFDLNVIPALKNVSHLPILVDPSHATGKTDLVSPVTLAGLAAGADGFIVEIHPRPYEAYSDGDQSLNFQQYDALLKDLNILRDGILTLRKQKLEKVELECI